MQATYNVLSSNSEVTERTLTQSQKDQNLGLWHSSGITYLTIVWEYGEGSHIIFDPTQE